MDTSVPLIEMDSAVINKGTDEQLVRQFITGFFSISNAHLTTSVPRQLV